jgi:glycine cleavage system aminomethyltransferase T
MQIVRFVVNARGVRMARTGDPVVSKRGECIGYVTSATAVEGAQFGMAYVDRRQSDEGTVIGIFQLPRDRGRSAEANPADLKPGERVLLHEEATIVSRFPARRAQ